MLKFSEKKCLNMSAVSSICLGLILMHLAITWFYWTERVLLNQVIYKWEKNRAK